MRLIYVFLFINTLLSLSACYPASTDPALIISPVGTIQAVTTAPATISVTIIPITEEAFTPTLTRSPIRVTKTSEEVREFPMPVTQSLTITVIYDNTLYDRRVNSAWGFSALVEYRDHILLFDTGGDGQMLMENMRILGIDPTQLESVVLSHAHGDHTGGLSTILQAGSRPVVYLLPSFPESFKRQVSNTTEVIEVMPSLSIAEGVFTTGEMGRNIPEQALVIQTDQGLVVITGCAHPGIIAILEQAREMCDEPVRLVLGGFHLGSKSKVEIVSILKDFRRIGVEQVAPCHCTGERAITMFAAEYGVDFIQAGVGRVVRLEVAGR